MNMESRDQAKAVLQGGYDLHMHAAPSPFQRLADDFTLLRQADEAGMAGILLKSHYESTAARAQMANAHCKTAAKAYGAVALNHPVGGLNPYAAENALKRGAKIIWMPTRDSANSLVSGNMPGDFFSRPGIRVLDDAGQLKPEVYEIMETVKKYDAVLATGHLATDESIAVCLAGRAQGVRMVLTHPEFDRTIVDAETQRMLAQKGVLVEKCWYNIAEHNCTAQQMAQHIRTVGAAHCFLTSDRGQSGRETPVEGMLRFLEALLEQGISEEELNTMVRTVPAKLLGIG